MVVGDNDGYRNGGDDDEDLVVRRCVLIVVVPCGAVCFAIDIIRSFDASPGVAVTR